MTTTFTSKNHWLTLPGIVAHFHRNIHFLNKENNKLILRYLNEGKTTIREIAKITDASTATIMKVKKVAIETKQLKVA